MLNAESIRRTEKLGSVSTEPAVAQETMRALFAERIDRIESDMRTARFKAQR